MSSSTAPTSSRSRSAAALAATALALAACGPLGPAAPSGPTASAQGPLAADRIQVLHTGDIHGHLEAESVNTGNGSFQQGGMAILAGAVNALRSRAPERTLLLDGGDAWVGTFASAADKGASVNQVMSLMRYDAMALGNHDFDWGQDALANRAKEATFPFLSANVVEAASGATPSFAKPFIVKDLGIAKVGILGLTNAGTPSITKASNTVGLRFLPLADTVRKYLPVLRSQADIVVVVDHSGADVDTQLAQQVPGIDLIVAAHDHVPLKTGRMVGQTTIVDAGAYTMRLGHLELTVDSATKKITATTRTDELAIVAGGRIAPDPAVATLVAARHAEGEKYTARVVGRATQRVEFSRDESPLGNLVTDALLEYGRRQGWQSDVAFYNNAGLRATLPQGDITYGKLYEALPFSDIIVSLDLTGTQLTAVFQAVANGTGRLSVAGAAFVYRFGSGTDHRLIAASVAGGQIDPTRVYHIVTNDYLLGGGDGHDEFKQGANVIFGDLEVDVVAAYLSAHSPVDPQIEGRVISQ